MENRDTRQEFSVSLKVSKEIVPTTATGTSYSRIPNFGMRCNK